MTGRFALRGAAHTPDPPIAEPAHLLGPPTAEPACTPGLCTPGLPIAEPARTQGSPTAVPGGCTNGTFMKLGRTNGTFVKVAGSNVSDPFVAVKGTSGGRAGEVAA
jgi:hypothetical protein